MANLQNSLIGKTIPFSAQRQVLVKEELPRGATCRCYVCEVKYVDETTETKLIKEFAPKNFDLFFSKDTFLRTIASRKEGFELAFKKYFNKISEVRSILLNIAKEDNSLKRYFVLPPAVQFQKDDSNPNNSGDSIVVFNSEQSEYCGLMLFDFDSTSMSCRIGELSIDERIEALIKLSKVINKFHERNLIIADIKPENFIYDVDEVGFCIKLFDFDSVIDLNEKITKVSCTPIWAPYELSQQLLNAIGLSSDLYSLGAMLLYFIMFDLFQNHTENKLVTFLHKQNKQEVLTKDVFLQLCDIDNNVTIGFWNKFVGIVNTTMNLQSPERRCPKEYTLPLDYFIEQLVILKEIYKNKGVHPEVMLNNAIKDINNKDKFSVDQFDPNLFTEIEVIE